MASRMSKTAESKLLSALDKASGYINTGTHPNDALIKAAEEFHVPAGHIHLMVNATNTGLTNAQRQQNDSIFDKAADFPIADSTTILEALYPNQIKTADILYKEAVVSDEYKRTPGAWIKNSERLEKVAQKFDWKLTDKPVPKAEPNEEHLLKKARADINRSVRAVNEARLDLSALRNQTIKLASDLRDYFCRYPKVSFADARINAKYYFGEQASTVLDHIEEQLSDKVTKVAVKTAHIVSMRDQPFSIIHDLIKTAKEFTLKKQALATAQEVTKKEVENKLLPFVAQEIGASVLDNRCSLAKAAGLLGDFARGGFGLLSGADAAKGILKNMPGATKEVAHNKLVDSLMDPRHELELRNIQTEAMLHDLMANDEIIRGYDPEEVVDSYNEIGEMYPLAAGKKAILRDLMRKRLTGGPQALDQFVTSDMARTEQQFKTLNEPTENRLKILQSLGRFNVPPQTPQRASGEQQPKL